MRSLASYKWRSSWAAVIYLTGFLFLFDISSVGQAQMPPLVVPIKGDLQSPNPPVKPNPLDDDKTINWTLNDAIQTALENNVDIAIERKNVRIAEYGVTAAQGVYDSVFTASPNFVSNIQPNIGRFSGVSASSNSTNTTTFSAGLGLQKQLEFGGGNFSTNFADQRTTSNSGIVSPLYSPQLSFSFTQPLWRNRHIDLNRREIYIAKKTVTLTDSQFRQQVITIISQVQQAYWNLAFAIHNVSVQTDGVALAQKQVEDNQKQVDVGMLAPLDVVAANTVLETRKQALIQANLTVEQDQNIIKTLVVGGPAAAQWDKAIVPTDFFTLPPITLSLTEALASGYANRPEVEQFKLQRDINNIDVDFFHNQAKPQIDLVAQYDLTGAGGTPVTTFSCPAGTTLDSTGACQPGNLPPIATTSNVNPTFIGGQGTALGNLFSNNFRNITVGLNVSLPLRNRTAQANLGKAIEAGKVTDLQMRKQLQTIEVDVRNAYRSVILAQENLDAARLARHDAEIQLDGEQKKFASGLSTTFLVLTRQNDLIQAKGAEISALAGYNNAVTAFQLATGTTLSSNNVEIK